MIISQNIFSIANFNFVEGKKSNGYLVKITLLITKKSLTSSSWENFHINASTVIIPIIGACNQQSYS